MPYGYYQMVRLGSAIGFAYLASFEKDKTVTLMWIYIGLAVLFQPLLNVDLGRTLWNVVDVVAGVWLLKDVLVSNQKRVISFI